MRAARGRRYRVPLRRTVGRRGDGPSQPDQSTGTAALAGHVLLWSRAATRTPEGLGRQTRECRGSAARFHAPRPDERTRGPGSVEARVGKGGVTRCRLYLITPPKLEPKVFAE